MNYMRLKQNSYCEKKCLQIIFWQKISKNSQPYLSPTIILLLCYRYQIFVEKKNFYGKQLVNFIGKQLFPMFFTVGHLLFINSSLQREKRNLLFSSYFSKSCQKDFRECFQQKTELDSFRNWQIFTKHRKNVYDDLIYKVNQY